MSYWTYIQGTITVRPMGRTQPEKRYILETVLNHLPRVTGSEGDMNVYIIQKNGYNSSCSCDEFGEVTNNLVDRYGYKSRNRGWLQTQDEYILVVNAALRDREFEQTYREFIKWFVRLCKRVGCKDIECKEISFCDIVFSSSKIELPGTDYIDTIKESSHVRYKYYGVGTKYTGTIFTDLRDNTISDNSNFYNNSTIDETIEYLESNVGIVVFWIFWVILIGLAVFGFYYLDNRWLD